MISIKNQQKEKLIIIIFTFLLLIIIGIINMNADESNINYKKEIYQINTNKVNNMNVIVYEPENVANKEMPAIVYLHGMDGCGNDPIRLSEIEGIPQYLEQKLISPNAIIIAPQCPSGLSWKYLSNDVIEVVEFVKNNYSINEAKISLTGASLGGIGTFYSAINNPKYFSAVVPVCGNVTASDCDVLSSVPIKIFHGTEDHGMGFSVIDANEVINKNGGNSELIILEGEGHEIRHIYYDEEYDILNWMIKQERKEISELKKQTSMSYWYHSNFHNNFKFNSCEYCKTKKSIY